MLAHRELVEGPDDDAIVRARVLAARPRRLLEVGSGLGEFCAWASVKLGGEVVAVDASPRMAGVGRAAGVEAVVADVRRLPFADAAFDCVVRTSSSTTSLIRSLRSPSSRGCSSRGESLRPRRSATTPRPRLQAWATLFREEKQPAPPPLSFSREAVGRSFFGISDTLNRPTATPSSSSRHGNGLIATSRRSRG